MKKNKNISFKHFLKLGLLNVIANIPLLLGWLTFVYFENLKEHDRFLAAQKKDKCTEIERKKFNTGAPLTWSTEEELKNVIDECVKNEQ